MVENNFADKQAALFNKDNKQYNLLIYKAKKVKYSIYKRQ